MKDLRKLLMILLLFIAGIDVSEGQTNACNLKSVSIEIEEEAQPSLIQGDFFGVEESELLLFDESATVQTSVEEFVALGSDEGILAMLEEGETLALDGAFAGGPVLAAFLALDLAYSMGLLEGLKHLKNNDPTHLSQFLLYQPAKWYEQYIYTYTHPVVETVTDIMGAVFFNESVSENTEALIAALATGEFNGHHQNNFWNQAPDDDGLYKSKYYEYPKPILPEIIKLEDINTSSQTISTKIFIKNQTSDFGIGREALRTYDKWRPYDEQSNVSINRIPALTVVELDNDIQFTETQNGLNVTITQQWGKRVARNKAYDLYDFPVIDAKPYLANQFQTTSRLKLALAAAGDGPQTSVFDNIVIDDLPYTCVATSNGFMLQVDDVDISMYNGRKLMFILQTEARANYCIVDVSDGHNSDYFLDLLDYEFEKRDARVTNTVLEPFMASHEWEDWERPLLQMDNEGNVTHYPKRYDVYNIQGLEPEIIDISLANMFISDFTAFTDVQNIDGTQTLNSIRRLPVVSATTRDLVDSGQVDANLRVSASNLLFEIPYGYQPIQSVSVTNISNGERIDMFLYPDENNSISPIAMEYYAEFSGNTYNSNHTFKDVYVEQVPNVFATNGSYAYNPDTVKDIKLYIKDVNINPYDALILDVEYFDNTSTRRVISCASLDIQQTQSNERNYLSIQENNNNYLSSVDSELNTINESFSNLQDDEKWLLETYSNGYSTLMQKSSKKVISVVDNELVLLDWVPGNTASLWSMEESEKGIFRFKSVRFSKYIIASNGSLSLSYNVQSDANFSLTFHHNDPAPEIKRKTSYWVANIASNRLMYGNEIPYTPLVLELPVPENPEAFLFSFKYLGALQYGLYNEAMKSYIVPADYDHDHDGIINDIINKTDDLPIYLGWYINEISQLNRPPLYRFENALLGKYLVADALNSGLCRFEDATVQNSQQFYTNSHFRIMEPNDPSYDIRAGRAHYFLASENKKLLHSNGRQLLDTQGSTWLIEHYPDNPNQYLIMDTSTKKMLADTGANATVVANISQLSTSSNDVGSAWLLEAGNSEGYFIKNTRTSNYLSIDNQDNLILSPDAPVEWHFEHVMEAPNINTSLSNVFLLEDQRSLFMHLNYNRSRVSLGELTESPEETWTVEYMGAEQYRILNDKNNQYLYTDQYTNEDYRIRVLSLGANGFYLEHDTTNNTYRFEDALSENYLGANNFHIHQNGSYNTFRAVADAMATINLALGKTATQSSTWGSGDAAKAVDGNRDGIYTNNSVTHTQSDTQAWWEVDLGADATIGGIVFYNRTEAADRLTNFIVFVSENPFPADARTGTLLSRHDVTSFRYTGTANAINSITMDPEIMGRYVRIQLVNTNFLSLAEVEVYGHWGDWKSLYPENHGPIRQGNLKFLGHSSGTNYGTYSGVNGLSEMTGIKQSAGFLDVDEKGWYGFQQEGPSDMKLEIDNQIVFDRNGNNIGYADNLNWVYLEKGFHKIQVTKNRADLSGGLQWKVPGQVTQETIPSDKLYYEPNFIGETGSFEIQQLVDESLEHIVEYHGDYTNPVVILSANTSEGLDPILMQVSDVDVGNHSFTAKLKEWDYKDGAHLTEKIDYLILESGYYTDFMGYPGVNVLAKNEWISGEAETITEVTLSGANQNNLFVNDPLVLHQSQTAIGTDAFISRIFNVENDRLEVVLQKESANRNRNPGQEDQKIGFVVMESGTQARQGKASYLADQDVNLTQNWSVLNMGSTFQDYISGNKVVLMNIQTMENDLRYFPAATIRGRNLEVTNSQGEVFYQQEGSNNNQSTPNTEQLGYLAFGNHQLLTGTPIATISDPTSITGTTYKLGDSYWDMNENAEDRISQIDGIASNGIQFWANQGLAYFDGTNGYLDLGNAHNVTKNFTIKAKFRYNTTGTVQTLIAKNNGNSNEVQYALCIDENGRMLFEYRRGGNGFALHGKSILPVDRLGSTTWNEVEVKVHDDLTIELVVNNHLEDMAVAPAETLPTTAKLFIGKTGGHLHSRFFSGKIDELLFLNSVQPRIGEIYYWDMLTNWNSHPVDLVPGNGNSLKLGTLRNGASLSSGNLNLDGNNDYVTFGYGGVYDVTNGYIIRARVKSDQHNNNKQTILSKWENDHNRPYVLFLEGGKVKFHYDGSGNGSNKELVSSTTVGRNWVDIMVRVDNNQNIELWINNELEATNVSDHEARSSTKNMVLGRWGDASGGSNGDRRYFDGRIDYVSVASLNGLSVVLKSTGKSTPSQEEKAFKIFPNPTTGKITIQLPDNVSGNLTWKLNTTIGTIVEQGSMENASTFELDISHLYEGSYILNIVNNDLGTVSKMITLNGN